MVDALDAEWRQHPPVHHLVAAYLGHKPPVQTTAPLAVLDAEEVLPGFGNMPIRQVAPLDTTAFDAAMKEAHHV